MKNPDDRNKMSAILYGISTFGHKNGRPLLSAIVVLADVGYPGGCFYKVIEIIAVMISIAKITGSKGGGR